METTALLTTSVIATAVISYVIYQLKLKLLREQLSHTDRSLSQFQLRLSELKNSNESLQARNHDLEISMSAYKEKEIHLNKTIKALQEDEEKLSQQFELLANRILNKQSSQLYEKQSQGMKDILEPLKEKIKSFEEKVDKTNLDSAKRHETLKEQIRSLSEKSERVSQDANNLAKALKGDYKKQGVWGEMILESILDKSGLEKNREYFTQVSLKDDNGKTQRPDVLINLPDNKILIIDSKVSLSAYAKMVESDNEQESKDFRASHLSAVKSHIDSLAEKNYHELYKVESPDFVLMFIPIDTAFTAALEADPELYNYAFEKNIVIVSSSTLLATLKTVESMWRNDKQNRNALAIASEAGKMYDKFANFLKDFDKMGAQLGTVQNSYNDCMKKLSAGTGNLLHRADKIRQLGAKANKKIESSKYV